MPYFIRRYQSGIKNSGTHDILTSEVEISIPTFVMLAESTGPGKYLLCERGPGIRGFKKITDCIIEEPIVETVSSYEPEELLFSAEESVSVKRNLSLKDMGNDDLMDLTSRFNRLGIGHRQNRNDNNMNGHIKRLTYYPVCITNEQMEALTS